MNERFLHEASTLIQSYYTKVKELVLKSDVEIYEQINKTMISLKKNTEALYGWNRKGIF